MQNFLQANRALAAEKNFQLVNRALAAEKNYYLNLNQIKSNPDGQPTVNRQSRLILYRGYLSTKNFSWNFETFKIFRVAVSLCRSFFNKILDIIAYIEKKL